MKTNPFSVSFGTEPANYISRFIQTDEVIEAFTADNASDHIFMITGVRGSGKTVLLTVLSDHFASLGDWIVINVTPETDILDKMVSKLYNNKALRKLFVKASINLSVMGQGITIENKAPVYDAETVLEQMLTELKKHGKKVLVALDEAVNNQYVKIFSASFQILIRQKLPVFLLMTGLYENINNLQNEKTLTFLYRAPKIMLDPLNIGAVARSYRDILKIDENTASEMARLTKGYPYAYQLLGYLYWNRFISGGEKADIEMLMSEFDNRLENYVYEKIWSELSPKEQEILSLIKDDERIKVADIREKLELTSSAMSVYRDRLNKKGLIDVSRFGYISLKLPRFSAITRIWTEN